MRLAAFLALIPATALAQSPLEPALVKGALCAGPCAVLTSVKVGHDPAGRDLYAVSVAAPRSPTEKLPANEDEADRRCLPEPFALLTLHAGHVVNTAPIVTLRAKGCGRSHEEIRLTGDKLVYDVQSGQTWTLVQLTTWQLAPVLHVIEKYEERFAHGGAPGQTVDRFLDTGVGLVETRIPYCGAVPTEGDAEPPHASFRYSEIPRSHASGDWRAPAFAPRGLTVDSAKHGGYLLSGSPSTPDDARFEISALSPSELWIEVVDDRVTARDAFEIYLGDALPPFPTACVPVPGSKRPTGDGGEIQSFVIPLKPSATLADPSGPDAPKVDRATDIVNGVPRTRLRVRLAKPPGSLTVVYADSDDGQTVARRIGTSTLKPDEPLSLGALGP